MASKREIRIPADSILALRRSLVRELKGATAARVLQDAGSAAGDAIFERLERSADESGLGATPHTSFWDRLDALFRELGWGSVEHRQIHPGVGALVARDWFEIDDTARRPTCHFTTGVLANILGRVADAEVAVLQVECDDGSERCCRFLFGAGPVLNQVYSGLREGRELGDTIGALG